MIVVQRAGVFTTVQDLGRRGWLRIGVPVSGALDAYALRVANVLVGNDEGAAALEMTAAGATLRFEEDAVVALTGGDFAAQAGGRAVPPWRATAVLAGAVLEVGGARRGWRAYLAVAGGIDVPAVLGSRSTLARARIGGLDGRALRTGDALPVGAIPALSRQIFRTRAAAGRTTIGAGPSLVPALQDQPVLRVLRGAQQDRFSVESIDAIFGTPYRILPESDRMGYRLRGESLQRSDAREMVSEPVVPGTIQVPPDGQPIILLSDAQSVGGYPKIAHVIDADLPLLAQAVPGTYLRFRAVSLAEAHAAMVERDDAIAALAASVRASFPE